MSRPTHLRVAVWVDGNELPAWLHRSLEAVRAQEGLTLTHVFIEAEAPRRSLRGLPISLYEELDRRVFGFQPDPEALLDARPLFEGAEVATAKASAAAAVLAEAAPDVLLHMGARPIANDALDVPRLGVWTWSQLETRRRGGVPALRVVEEGGAVRSELWLLRPEPAPPGVLTASWSNADPARRIDAMPVSLCRARFGADWMSAQFAARTLRDWLAGSSLLESALPAAEPVGKRDRAGLFGTVRLGLRAIVRLVQRRAADRRVDARWWIAVRPRRPGLPCRSMDGFRQLPMPPDRFFADPCLIRHGGRHLLFYEDADRETELGRIACAEIDAQGEIGPSMTVLEEPHHLSYPFVFHWKDDWWMIPESASARQVVLYRATEFPSKWVVDQVLFDGVRAVDATVHARDGRLWMFVNMAPEGVSTNDELHLFHANDPRGPWHPHPRNPIVSDARQARSAGRLFEFEGQLYRPAQDCSERYGGAMALQRIEEMDEETYRETKALHVEPDWEPDGVGTHTLSFDEDLEVVDVRILEPR